MIPTENVPYTDKLRIIPETEMTYEGLDPIVGYIVQKWYGFKWPFGFWITNTDIGIQQTEDQAITKCIEHYSMRPVVDDHEYLHIV